jgi:Xaa-Pro dipeptidase
MPTAIAPPSLELPCCRQRQSRLCKIMAKREIDGVLISRREHLNWLFGVYLPPTLEGVGWISADGRATFIAPHKRPELVAADVCELFPAKWLSTMRNDQMSAALEKLASVIGSPFPGKSIGIEGSACPWLAQKYIDARLIDLEADLLSLRRKKEADELRCLQYAIAATGKMYQRARELIRPGVSEIEIFNELQSVAVSHLGEPLTGTGNDYQCASRGGAPRRNITAQPGQLYILDLGPAYRGYFADNARTIAVTEPTAIQLDSARRALEVFPMIEAEVKPGVSCRKIFEQAQQMLDLAPVGVFNHHLGHGIGLAPHEGPHLNPNWDDTFEVGDVFAVEPGLYDASLAAGLRIENDYLVTESGVQLLSDFPLEL